MIYLCMQQETLLTFHLIFLQMRLNFELINTKNFKISVYLNYINNFILISIKNSFDTFFTQGLKKLFLNQNRETWMIFIIVHNTFTLHSFNKYSNSFIFVSTHNRRFYINQTNIQWYFITFCSCLLYVKCYMLFI